MIWTYVSKNDYFHENADKKKLQEVNRMNYILPIAAIVAIGVTFVKPSWSPYSYFVIIVLKMTFNRFS